MADKNHNNCNRIPETSRCNRRKKSGECPAVALGKKCISPNTVKEITQLALRISGKYAGVNISA